MRRFGLTQAATMQQCWIVLNVVMDNSSFAMSLEIPDIASDFLNIEIASNKCGLYSDAEAEMFCGEGIASSWLELPSGSRLLIHWRRISTSGDVRKVSIGIWCWSF